MVYHKNYTCLFAINCPGLLFSTHAMKRSWDWDSPFCDVRLKIIAKTKWHHDECRSSLAYDETYFAGNYCAWDICSLMPEWRTGATTIHHMWAILLMEEILHQLIGSLSHYLQVLHIPAGAGFLPSTVVDSLFIADSHRSYAVLW